MRRHSEIGISISSASWLMSLRMVLMSSLCLEAKSFQPFSELRDKAVQAGLDVVDVFGWGFPFYSPLYRTVIEWIPGGPPTGEMGRASAVVARALYQLYRLNVPRRGDVVTLLVRRPHDDRQQEIPLAENTHSRPLEALQQGGRDIGATDAVQVRLVLGENRPDHLHALTPVRPRPLGQRLIRDDLLDLGGQLAHDLSARPHDLRLDSATRARPETK